jgi:hypothetical protein
MKKNLLSIFSIMMLLNLSAQLKGGIEHYSYFSNDAVFVMEPVLHIQTARGIYGELRYNYEKKDAVSFNAGKTFLTHGKLTTILTPMLGIVAGAMKGYNLALNQETDWKNFYFSSQSQYCRSFSKGDPGFFFSWSESGYNISPVLFTAIALQCGNQAKNWDIDPGVMSGINLKNVSVSFYVFNPLCSDSYFVAGLKYECYLSKRK